MDEIESEEANTRDTPPRRAGTSIGRLISPSPLGVILGGLAMVGASLGLLRWDHPLTQGMQEEPRPSEEGARTNAYIPLLQLNTPGTPAPLRAQEVPVRAEQKERKVLPPGTQDHTLDTEGRPISGSFRTP